MERTVVSGTKSAPISLGVGRFADAEGNVDGETSSDGSDEEMNELGNIELAAVDTSGSVDVEGATDGLALGGTTEICSLREITWMGRLVGLMEGVAESDTDRLPPEGESDGRARRALALALKLALRLLLCDLSAIS